MRTKLRKSLALLVFGVVMGLGSNAHALPLLGTADPYITAGFALEVTTTGQVLFSFSNVDNGNGFVATAIFLTLESDIFDLANTSINAPVGWNVTSPLIGDGFDSLTAIGGGSLKEMCYNLL